ncbi:MAG: hypothetical protein AAF657_18105 [Acidobacteriota bacterium]
MTEDFLCGGSAFYHRLALDLAEEVLDAPSPSWGQVSPEGQRIEMDGHLGGVLVAVEMLASARFPETRPGVTFGVI